MEAFRKAGALSRSILIQHHSTVVATFMLRTGAIKAALNVLSTPHVLLGHSLVYTDCTVGNCCDNSTRLHMYPTSPPRAS